MASIQADLSRTVQEDRDRPMLHWSQAAWYRLMEISSVEFATALLLEKEGIHESCGLRKDLSFWPISIDGQNRPGS